MFLIIAPIYQTLLIAAALVLSPVWLMGLILVPKWRPGFWEKLGFHRQAWREQLQTLKQQQPSTVWVHAVSVGETNAIAPVVKALSQEHTVVLSTTTVTSQTMARNRYPEWPVFYFPFDFFGSVEAAFKHIQPRLIILTETELWPYLILLAKHREIPIVLVNGRLSERSFKGYLRFRYLIALILQQLTHAYVQTEEDARRYQALGLESSKLSVMGNLKFDGTQNTSPEDTQRLRHLFQWRDEAPVLTIASTHPGEEVLLIPVYQALKRQIPDLKLILTPRHPERCADVEAVLRQAGVTYTRRSTLDDSRLNTECVVLLDTIGELSTCYGLSTVAIIGGSFIEKRGGQNPIEALQQRIPAVFGPYMSNFKAVVAEILKYQPQAQVDSAQALAPILIELFSNNTYRKQWIEQGNVLLAQNQGTTSRLLNELKQYTQPKKGTP